MYFIFHYIRGRRLIAVMNVAVSVLCVSGAACRDREIFRFLRRSDTLRRRRSGQAEGGGPTILPTIIVISGNQNKIKNLCGLYDSRIININIRAHFSG